MSTVNTQNLKEDYNTVVEGLASSAFKAALDYFDSVVDEEGNKVNIYFEDICNGITNAAQLARRTFVDANK